MRRITVGSFSKKGTGSRSSFGGPKPKRTLVPWGRVKAQPTVAKPKVTHGKHRKHSSDNTLTGVSYPANKPAYWPIEGEKRRSPTAPTSDNADRHNAIVEGAFTRGGYGA